VTVKAFAYLRVSGRGQVEGDGFTRQVEAIRAYAKTHNVRLAKIYREEGVSGTKDLDNRPALGALLDALDCDGTKLVLVEKLDRLARDLMVQESILHDISRKGFQLVSVAEPDLCSDDPSRKLMRQIMGAFSEYEKTMIVLKLSGARTRIRAAEGRCEGRKAYGFREGEQVVLARAKTLRQGGMAYSDIAACLNTEGVPSRSGGTWHAGVVHRILASQ
jgi:DNA invertase Pin-like site-specific DNA recombinase